MNTSRRALLASTIGLSVGALATDAAAQSAGAPSLAPLRDAGFEPFEVYVRMFASLADGAECCWWFMGALPREIENIGAVDTVQEETARVHRTKIVAPGNIEIHWKQAGVFRDVVTGEVPNSWIDPVTGAADRQASTLKGGPAKILVSKSVDGVTVANEAKGSASGLITLDAKIEGDRVGLTHVEDKTRQTPNGPSTNRTVFKIYANLADLKTSAPSVITRGFYGVRNLATGRVFVNGMMQKAGMAEKINPIAWERIKAAHPAFFKGDRLAPGWEG